MVYFGKKIWKNTQRERERVRSWLDFIVILIIEQARKKVHYIVFRNEGITQDSLTL